MAQTAGYGGEVLFAAAVVAELGEWDLTVNRDSLDTSAFQSAPGWKSNIPGLGDWTATVTGGLYIGDTTGQLVIINAGLNGTSVTPKFSVDGGSHYYSGTAFVTSFAFKCPVAGRVEFSATFKGNGAPAYT